jgi:hypothetical protein
VVAARPDAPWGAGGGMRRTVVRGAGQQLGEDDRDHDLARGLRVRAAARLGAEGDQEEGAEVVRHRHMVAGGEDDRPRS